MKWSFNPCFSGCCSSTYFGLGISTQTACFNPCFSGCCSSTSVYDKVNRQQPGFQSLFQWMLLFDKKNKNEELPLSVFQSLFQWMLLFDCYLHYHIWRLFYSFNPCFSGCCSSTKFQSVVVQMFTSFNPCFSGCCSSTTYTLNHHTQLKQFQSLFQWMLLFDNSTGSLVHPIDAVSILVLVDVALRPFDASNLCGILTVSILVLVDVALRPQSTNQR